MSWDLIVPKMKLFHEKKNVMSQQSYSKDATQGNLNIRIVPQDAPIWHKIMISFLTRLRQPLYKIYIPKAELYAKEVFDF